MQQAFSCSVLPHIWCRTWQEAQLATSAHACVSGMLIVAVLVQQDTHKGAAEVWHRILLMLHERYMKLDMVH